jgi:ketosteroid isomerase-like protein
MLDAAEAELFARRWAAAWNDRDLEAVLTHFADGCVFTSPVARQLLGGDGVIHGKQALREYWTHALEKVPDLHFEVLGVHAGIDTLVIHYRNQRGIEVCEVLTFGPDGLVHLGHGTYRGTSGNPAGAR